MLLFTNVILTDLKPSTLLKERLRHCYYPVNFTEVLRTVYFTENPWWMLLSLYRLAYTI